MNEIVIALDAMGGDNAPSETIKGCIDAVSKKDNVKILLVGIDEIIRNELNKYNFDKDKIDIVHAGQVIGNDEVPTIAIKNKKDSSIVVGLNLVKEKKALAFISAGNTGALLTGAITIIKRIKGIERPALGTLLPTEKGYCLLIDAGANVDCKANYLVQFAKMGAVYMENVLRISNPKIGLVNIGAEKEKGNSLTKECYELLENAEINFIGNVEARDITAGVCDVVVCDAFVGNVILKFAEGFGKTILKVIKNEFTADLMSKTGAILAKGAFKRLKNYFDYSDVGGAPFLGLNALVVKAHGSSKHEDFEGAINQCLSFIENDIVGKIQEKI